MNDIDDPSAGAEDPTAPRLGVIAQAEGAIILLYGLDEPAAAAILRARAHYCGIDLAELAARVVAELPDPRHPEEAARVRARLDRLLLLDTTHSALDPNLN
ncbi:ANTAR domain-containing protein [Nocardia aurea]|uniref:ANTAR domain-containing protein n=1 Tax=Nocardia aurea TaxID=2144174 RepID=A0ABV3FXR4_9NOCA